MQWGSISQIGDCFLDLDQAVKNKLTYCNVALKSKCLIRIFMFVLDILARIIELNSMMFKFKALCPH